LGAHTEVEEEVLILSCTFLTFCQQLREGLGGSAEIIKIKNKNSKKIIREKQKQKTKASRYFVFPTQPACTMCSWTCFFFPDNQNFSSLKRKGERVRGERERERERERGIGERKKREGGQKSQDRGPKRGRYT
jgi:hypothetical protein